MTNRIAFHVLLTAACLAGCVSRSVQEAPAPVSETPIASPRPPEPAPPPPPPPPAAQTSVPPPAHAPIAVTPTPESKSGPDAAPRMTIAEAQKRLTALGYRPGPIDGQLGARTVAALRLFQRDQRLRRSGTLDAETIERLRTARRR